MNLHLTGHHLEITPAIREYVSGKITRITRHFDHVIDVNVVLTVEKLRHRIEAGVHVFGKDIFCESANSDMYAAIDSLVDKLVKDGFFVQLFGDSVKAEQDRKGSEAFGK